MIKETKDLTNFEIVTLAVYLLGGETQAIDSEHVAVKAAQLAPGRYNWRFYPEQINIHIVGAFLADAKKPKNGSYLSGSINEGWMLTEAGALFANESITRLKNVDLAQQRRSDSDKKWLKRERSRLLATDAFMKLKAGDTVTSRDAAIFFRVDEYITGDARDRKITRIVNAFRTDQELGSTVMKLRTLVNEVKINDE